MSAIVKRKWNWNQGTDLPLHFVYKVGADAGTAVPPANFDEWSVQMTVRAGTIVVGTINSDATVSDTITEASLDEDGNIFITLGRELTLTTELSAALTAGPVIALYDIILRNPGDDTQFKLAEGRITIDPSITLWP